jgi:xylulokinase
MKETFTLGIDVSTQSISAVAVRPEPGPAKVLAEHTIAYRDDPRLNCFGIHCDSLLVPPRVAGEADQPPEMFLAGLDALFEDLRNQGFDLSRIAAVSVSAQQHGHVYLSAEGLKHIGRLNDEGTGTSSGADLVTRLAGSFAYGTAPIWQTSDSQAAADEIRSAMGGTRAVVEASGSDSPARFTGAVMRRTARRYPEAWQDTALVSLLSSFISGVLTARPDCPVDWGNGAGMTLMDYRTRQWSPELLQAVAADLPGGVEALKQKLPETASPVTPAGTIARYFVTRYGFSPECIVNAGSGDNPQSKVMIDGDLLSLGTSFVYMVDTGEPVVDLQGYANSMYDGLGRPFVFACRTNGAMVWDRLRRTFGADYAAADGALDAAAPGATVAIWQPYAESYPVASPVDNPAARTGSGDFGELYPPVVDSALVLTRHYARGFESNSGPLALTGGPASSKAIVRRVAAVFERPVIVMESSGAAMGSALSAWQTLCDVRGRDADTRQIRMDLVSSESPVAPDPDLVAAFHEARPKIVKAFEEAVDT